MMTPMIHHQALTVRNVVNSIHYRKVHLRGDAENVDISINVKSLKNPKKKSKKSKRRKKDPDSNGENGVYHGADLIIDSGVLELALQYMRDSPRANHWLCGQGMSFKDHKDVAKQRQRILLLRE
eukprot:776307_1